VGVRALVEDVTDAAFRFAGDVVVYAICVVLALPKQILLAGGFEVDPTTRASDWTPQSGAGTSSIADAMVRSVTNPILLVLIGVNPPKHLANNASYRSHVLQGRVEVGRWNPATVQQIATASHPCCKSVRPTLIDDGSWTSNALHTDGLSRVRCSLGPKLGSERISNRRYHHALSKAERALLSRRVHVRGEQANCLSQEVVRVPEILCTINDCP
jgi:hypothetical protein